MEERRNKMKKLILILIVLLTSTICSTALAEDTATTATATETTSAFSITTKQGLLYIPVDSAVKQFTAFEVIKTDVAQVSSWPKWLQAIYAGWTLDAGFAYDDSDVLSDGALCLGRKMGTLADYLPIKFPLASYIDITIYPVGLYIEKVFTNPKNPKFGFGGAYIKAEIKFG
jgi:ABC-type glycerol-3-phosphate transport system substrate-binding protein